MPLPSHLMIGCDGDLCDTRKGYATIRKQYARTHASISTPAQFKSTLRGGEFTWPGGYPMFLVCSDGAPICFACARKEARSIIDSIRRHLASGWRVEACDINYEDTALFCDHCGEKIPSAYGGDDEEDNAE